MTSTQEDQIIQFIMSTWENIWQEVKKGTISVPKKRFQQVRETFIEKYGHLTAVQVTKKREVVIRSTDGWAVPFPDLFFWSEVRCSGQLFSIVQPLVQSIKDLNTFFQIIHQQRMEISASLTKTDQEILEQLVRYSSIKLDGLSSLLSKDLQRSRYWINIRLRRLWLGGVVHFRAYLNHSRLGLVNIICRFPRSYQLSFVEQQYHTYQQFFKGEKIVFLIMPKYSSWWAEGVSRYPAYRITQFELSLNLGQRKKNEWGSPPDFYNLINRISCFLDHAGKRTSFWPLDLKILEKLHYGSQYQEEMAQRLGLSRRETISERLKVLEKKGVFKMIPIFPGLSCPLRYFLICTNLKSIQALQPIVSNCPISMLYQGHEEPSQDPFLIASVRLPTIWQTAFERVMKNLNRKLTTTAFRYSRVSQHSSAYFPKLSSLWNATQQRWHSEEIV